MNDMYMNLWGVVIGILLCGGIFMFMALIIFVKKGFEKIFQNIDALVKRINSFLDSSNK
jgi:hypothetical protein